MMVDSAHAAWTNGHLTDVLLMGINSAVTIVSKGRLVNLMKVKKMDGDLIQWTECFVSERSVVMITEGNDI